MTNPLLTSWISSILGLLGFLFVVPLASAHLDAPQFTLWLFANSVIAIGVVFETSVSVVFTRMLTDYMEKRSFQEAVNEGSSASRVSAFISTSLMLYLALGGVAALAAYVVARASLGGLLSLGLDPIIGRQTLLACAGIASSSIILAFARSVLIADRNLREQRIMVLLSSVAKLALSSALIVAFGRVDVAMASIALVNVLELAVGLLLSRHELWPALRTRPSLRVMDEFLAPFLRTFCIRIGGYLTLYASTLIVVRFTPAAADAYLLSFRLAMAAASVAAIPLSISLPALTRLRTRIRAGVQPASALPDTALRLISFSTWCTMAFLLLLLLVGRQVMNVLADGQELLALPALAYLCLIFLLEGHHTSHIMVYETQNRVPMFAISLISGLCIVALSLLLVPRFGIWGGLVAMNLVQMAANNWVPVRLNLQQWGMPWPSYLARISRFGLRLDHIRAVKPDA